MSETAIFDTGHGLFLVFQIADGWVSEMRWEDENGHPLEHPKSLRPRIVSTVDARQALQEMRAFNSHAEVSSSSLATREQGDNRG